MVEVVDRANCSRMMAGIRGRNTQPEVALRSALHALGLRFRIHDRRLPGRPDVVFPKHRAVVQVHGCFWHRHEGCRFTTIPSSNADFWNDKFQANIIRDRENVRGLEGSGWRSAVVWECAIRDRGADEVAAAVADWLVSNERRLEIPGANAPGSGS